MIEQKKCTVRQVQCLTGLLNFLNKAIVPGRAFTHRMYTKIALKDSKGCALKPIPSHKFRRRIQGGLQNVEAVPIEFKCSNLCRPFIDLDALKTATQLDFSQIRVVVKQKDLGVCLVPNTHGDNGLLISSRATNQALNIWNFMPCALAF